jgi:hypothetical protein
VVSRSCARDLKLTAAPTRLEVPYGATRDRGRKCFGAAGSACFESLMAEVESLSALSQFAWGCLGGAILFAVSFALPELRAAAQADDLCRPGALRMLVVVLLASCLIALGGAGALLLGDATEPSQAIAYGLASEGLIAGVLRSGDGP